MGCVNSAAEDDPAELVPSNKNYFLQGGAFANNDNSSNTSSNKYTSVDNDDDDAINNNAGSLLGRKNDDDNTKKNNSTPSKNNKKKYKPTPEEIESLLGKPVPIYLNVYNLQKLEEGQKKSANAKIGFGVYHSGVQVFNFEFSFGGAPGAPANTPGIFPSHPRSCLPPDQFHKQIHMGNIYGGMTLEDVRKVLLKMNPNWLAASYHLLAKNCNHFAEAFLEELSKEFHVTPVMKPPTWVNRAARWGDVVIPDRIYNYFMDQVPQAPPTAGDASSASAASSAAKNNASTNIAPPSPTTTTNNKNKNSNNSNNNNIPPPRMTPQAPQYPHHNHNHSNQSAFSNASPIIEDEEDDILASMPIPTKQEMEIMSIKEIKTVMWVHGISWDGCLEKSDIIERVEEFSRKNQAGSETQKNFMAQRYQEQQPSSSSNQVDRTILTGTTSTTSSSPAPTTSTGVLHQGTVLETSNNNNEQVNNNKNNNNNNTNQQEVDPSAVETIQSMGFDCSKSKIEEALRQTRNNIDRAIDLLLR